MNSWIYADVANEARWLHVTAFTLRLLIAAFFVTLAARSLTGDAQIAADFRRFGYSDGFRVLIAVGQIAGAAMLVWSRTAFFGGALLAGIMLGAIYCHVRHDPIATAIAPAVFLLLTAALAFNYRPPALR